MTSIKINSVEIYHPKKAIHNEYYLEHFKGQGKDISHFLEIMGREKRYIVDNNEENTQTMAIEAAHRVLKKSGLEGKDIDMIIFSSQIPETTVPTNAIFVHNAINARKDTIIYDTNANCAGMTIAVEQASRYMLSNPHASRALVVGADYFSLISDPTDPMTFANFGDGAAAIILEKTEEDIGFIDAMTEVDSSNRNNILYPAQGLAQGLKGNGTTDYMLWLPFDGSMSIPATCEMFEKLLERNGLTINDVNSFCFSQFAHVNIKKIQEHFSIPDEKMIYVGDSYGYTGTSSPFFALYEGIESGRIKRGDVIMFWTIGGGHEFISMLYRY
ncbi:ketoacyl-ACP synthase III [Lysinibacillus sp. 54212]|uniref:ketoacyl-ACP synthase III n=1 Tax=Lysinibacillus sp. 54212 TaxID=3119829 RepID=UPI002FC951CB